MTRIVPCLMVCTLLISPLVAQDEKPEDPVHKELRDLRDSLKESFNKNDIDALVAKLHPDVVVTWQDGNVSRKREGVKEYYKKTLTDADSPVEKITLHNLEVKELSIFHGPDKDTGVAFGTLGDHYQMRDGQEFTLNSRWSVTVVKENGEWLIANAHLSAPAFENEVMEYAIKKVMWWTGIIAAVVGLLIGIGLTLLLKKKKGGATA